MSGDYSRKRFNPEKLYQGVLRQQGRVDLDADWNEYVDLQDRRWRAETIDVVGRCGVPAETPEGFKIEVSGGELTVGPGRMYVDGYLAENHGTAPVLDATIEEQYGNRGAAGKGSALRWAGDDSASGAVAGLLRRVAPGSHVSEGAGPYRAGSERGYDHQEPDRLAGQNTERHSGGGQL